MSQAPTSDPRPAAAPEPKLAPKPTVWPSGRNMLAVASGKGGVGKTWFAITFAQALARRRRKVLLFDGDLGLANVDIQLGLMAQYDLGSVIAGKMPLNQAAVNFESGKFDVIAGRSGSGSLANVPPARLKALADDLVLFAQNYDNVVIDLGAGVERAVRMMAASAATTIVVCNDEPTSLTDAYAYIKVTAMERPRTDIRLVINAVNSRREGERTYATLLKACQGFLKMTPPLLGIIRRDSRVRESIRNQSPIITRYPNADAAHDVEDIVDTFLRN